MEVEGIEFMIAHEAKGVIAITHGFHHLQRGAHATRVFMAGLGVDQVTEEQRLMTSGRDKAVAIFFIAESVHESREFVEPTVNVGDDVVVHWLLHNAEMMPQNIYSCYGVVLLLYDSSVMNQFDNLFAISGLSLDRLRTFLQVADAGNISKAAAGDPTKQSQFSRQIKEMEAFFGVALTRRVGRRIEITEEGQQLALVIRRQFRELDDFRESMQGRSVTVRLGAQGSVIDWLVLPRIAEAYKALGNALIEVEQMRTLDIVRAVADGRLDFGIVRDDALPKGLKRWKLGQVGYALFAANALWKKTASAEEMIRKAPMIELLAGGQFSTRWQAWLEKEKIRPKIIARVSSFTDAAKAVQTGHAAAVLPDLAAVDFDPKKFQSQPIPAMSRRSLVLVANARGIDRAGISANAAEKLMNLLKIG